MSSVHEVWLDGPAELLLEQNVRDLVEFNVLLDSLNLGPADRQELFGGRNVLMGLSIHLLFNLFLCLVLAHCVRDHHSDFAHTLVDGINALH